MNRKRLFRPQILAFVTLLLIGFFAFMGTREESERPIYPDERNENCTVIMVGKEASVDGSTMTTHTADCGFCDWTWGHIPAADHKPGETRKLYHISQYKTWPPSEGLKWQLYKKDFNGVEIPEVSHAFAYHHGMFGYMNENQVAISESTIGTLRKLVNSTPSAVLDLTMLTLLAMERARTAREAVQIMGEMVEKFGYGFHDDGEMLAVSDPNEVWVFEIMPVGVLWTPQSGKPGAVWCAQRVPDDHVSVCPNESRIGEIDLNDPDYFMASPNVITFAVEQGLYDPKSGTPFNWKRTYSPAEGSAVSTDGRRARLWRFLDLVAPSQKFKPDTPNMDFPFSVKPDTKLSVQDVMNLTRDKCYGTRFDPVKGIRGGPFANPNYFRNTRTISSNRAEYTSLVQCRGWLPDPIGGIVWLAFGAQDTSCYMPLYAGITEMPKSFTIGDHWEFNRASARWAFDYVDFHTQVVYSSAIEDVQKAILEWEAGVIAQIPEIDQKAQKIYAGNKAKARKFLTDFCLDHADKVIAAWGDLGDRLVVQYNHLLFYNTEKRTRDRNRPAFSDDWKKAVKMVDIFVEPEEKR
ncbi:MAG: C69 family dipeptidase [Candidatus Aminicenantales bacterium]